MQFVSLAYGANQDGGKGSLSSDNVKCAECCGNIWTMEGGVASSSLAPRTLLRFLLVNCARSSSTVVSSLHPPGVSPHDFCCGGDVNWKLLTSLLSDVTSWEVAGTDHSTSSITYCRAKLNLPRYHSLYSVLDNGKINPKISEFNHLTIFIYILKLRLDMYYIHMAAVYVPTARARHSRLEGQGTDGDTSQTSIRR